jgi:hypothetical protein
VLDLAEFRLQLDQFFVRNISGRLTHNDGFSLEKVGFSA